MEAQDLFSSKMSTDWESMTQKQRVRYWLEFIGPITPLEALKELGIYRLGARIYDLKREGMNIETLTQSEENRFGHKISFAKYQLEKGYF